MWRAGMPTASSRWGTACANRLLARGVPAERITIAHNWADGTAIVPLDRVGDAAELVLLYSGNLGLAHDLSTVVGAMTTLRDDTRFRFLFVGSGGRRAELAAAVVAEQWTQVELRPYVERASLSESLAAGDIGLVTQREECCGSVVPSKVYGLLASGSACAVYWAGRGDTGAADRAVWLWVARAGRRAGAAGGPASPPCNASRRGGCRRRSGAAGVAGTL